MRTCETKSSICGIARRPRRQEPIFMSSATSCEDRGASGALSGFSIDGACPEATKSQASLSPERLTCVLLDRLLLPRPANHLPRCERPTTTAKRAS